MIMQTNGIEKPLSSNLSVKLDTADRERLKSLALAKKRTPHYVMREAIQKYIAEEEIEQRFIAAAEDSWEDYEKTGLHVTLKEAKSWAKGLKKNPNAPLPVGHK